MITVLDFLLLSWAFWLIAPGLTVIAYIIVSELADEKEWGFAPLFFLALAGGALWYRYPEVRLTWSGAAWAAAGYVAAGFILSLWKWLTVLLDFKKLPVAVMIACQKADARIQNPSYHAQAVLNEAARKLAHDCTLKGCKVVENAGTITIYPDWRRHPIATWFTYWPFFLFSVVLDPVKRGIARLVQELKELYESIAKRFKVEG